MIRAEMQAARVLYDVTLESPPIQNEVRGALAGTLIGVILLALVWKRRERAPRLFVLLWIAGWIGFSLWNGVEIVRNQKRAIADLKRGAVEVREGILNDPSPAPLEGGFETFRVGDQPFKVGDGSDRKAGLSQRSKRLAPLRAGAHVRIASSEGRILKLEEIEEVAKR